jgi:hypothetical protein
MQAQLTDFEHADGDEFIDRNDKDIDEIRNNLNKNLCNNCTEGLENFNFNFSNTSTVLLNESLAKKARERKLNQWFNHQKNNILKPEIEKALNQKFSNYDQAKDALFKATENRNFDAYAYHPRSKYNTALKRVNKTKNAQLKQLKILKVRERELKNGNINNALYADIKINNIPVNHINNLSNLDGIKKSIIAKFEPNAAQAHNYHYIAQKLYSFSSSDLTKMLDIAKNRKHEYHNRLDQWDQLSYMQALIYQYTYLNSQPMVLANTLPKFDYRMLDSEYIEQYAIANNTGGYSIFDAWWIHKYAHEMANGGMQYPETIPMAEQRVKAERAKKLSELLGNASINNSHLIDRFTETFHVRDKYKLQYLNDNYENQQLISKMSQSLNDVASGSNSNAAYIKNIKTDIDNGAIQAGFMDKIHIDNINIKKFLYNNSSILNELQTLAGNNIQNHQFSDEIKLYIKTLLESYTTINSNEINLYKKWVHGQLQLENITNNIHITWTPNPGKIYGRDNQAYTHTWTDGIRSAYKMKDGSIVLKGDDSLILTADNKFISQYWSDANGTRWFIKPGNSKYWSSYLLLGPKSTKDELSWLLTMGVKEIAKNIGTYVLPIEEIKVLIDGKNFNGQQISRFQAAGFILLAVVPGGKIFKIVTKIPRNAVKWAIGTIDKGGKAIKLTFNVINGMVMFGSRSNLAKIILTKAGEEAHHIIPWAKRTQSIIQKAAKAGFHMNSKINGIALEKFKKLTGTGIHGNHPAYDTFVQRKLDEFVRKNPNFSPEKAKDFLEIQLIPQLLHYIDLAKNSGLNLNEFFKTLI